MMTSYGRLAEARGAASIAALEALQAVRKTRVIEPAESPGRCISCVILSRPGDRMGD